ncbi:hypothetical protein [Thalassovita taeanensis]|uniref:Lipoprotein n=1 Tax=Thalassovita taeanensis TaxID=657014 RepID=A0A1H9JC19_9RHOB|nr:hypothetical protein [Thalassovita taeanensis]SEQ84279.1 hypothetical protein SAMN04488092_11494 [Thalassovita taeanensis]
MRTTLSALLISTLVVSGCGAARESRLNPFNWFGRSQSTPTTVASEQTANPLIPQSSKLKRKDLPYQGQLVDQVSDLVIEKVPGGALVRVTGVSAAQGAFDVRLIAQNGGKPDDGVLSYELRALQPAYRRPVVGPAAGRTVTVARFLSEETLIGVKTIQVVGNQNVRSSRRR